MTEDVGDGGDGGKIKKLRKKIEGAKVVPIRASAMGAASGMGGGNAVADDVGLPDHGSIPLGDDAPPPHDGDDTNEYGLPKGCPVIPLGKRGSTYFYLNPLRELVPLSFKDHSQTGMRALFSPKTGLLYDYWPQRKEFTLKDKEGKIVGYEWRTTGFKVADGMEALMNACSRLGVWKSLDRVRGPGGWLDEATGGLVFHCGDKLWSVDENGNISLRDPGRFDGFVYTADTALIRPYDIPVDGGEHGPARELIDLFRTWRMARPLIDGWLLLGQALAGMVGGALDWRPMIFITGDAETGKSTLQNVLRLLHGPEGMIKSANATEASLSSAIGMSCLPVSVDELENEVDNERAQNVIKLARLASSGDLRLRGSQNHEVHASRALSCFIFSAIIMPPMPSQDRRRTAIIRLDPHLKGTTSPVIVPKYFHELGSKLKRRLADQWHRYGHIKKIYRAMLARAGHSSGALDQYGTMMALAHMALHDDDPEDAMLLEFELLFAASTFRETSDSRSNAQSCLDELCQAQPEQYRGTMRKSVARLVSDIVNDKKGLLLEGFDDAPASGDEDPLRLRREALAATGLAVIKSKDGLYYLAVPHAHRQVAELFKNSNWKGISGTSGGWVEALSRLQGVKSDCPTRIDNRVTKCLHVPVSLVVTEVEKEAKQEEKNNA